MSKLLRVICAQLSFRATSAGIAGPAGIAQSLTYHIENIKRGFTMSLSEYASIAALLLGIAGVIIIFKPWDLD
jgi:hypothetical protein